ncbi:hypothetical protein P7C70_g9255, partial [Phenoliferia sp. Uapishka_3]
MTSSRGTLARLARDLIIALFGLTDENGGSENLRAEITWLLESRTHLGNTPAGMAQLDPSHPRFRPYQNKSLRKFITTVRKRVTGDSDRRSITPEFVGFCMSMVRTSAFLYLYLCVAHPIPAFLRLTQIKNALECYQTGSYQLVNFTEKRYGKYVADIANNMRTISFANTPWIDLRGLLTDFNNAAFPVQVETTDPTGFVCYEEDSGEEDMDEEEEEEEEEDPRESRRNRTSRYAHVSSSTVASDDLEDVKDELIDEFEQGLEADESEERPDAAWDEGQTDPCDDEEMDQMDADLHGDAQPDFLELDDSDSEFTEQTADGMAVDGDELDEFDEFGDEFDDPDATDLCHLDGGGPGPRTSASREGGSPDLHEQFDDGAYAPQADGEDEEEAEEGEEAVEE